jgi:hypothetical protein
VKALQKKVSMNKISGMSLRSNIPGRCKLMESYDWVEKKGQKNDEIV